MSRGLLAAMLAVAAAGCGGRSGHEPAVLRFWAMGREGEVVQELVRDFERANPDVRVEVQQIPWSAAHEKLLTAFVGGTTPDVAQLGNTWIAEFVALRALEPLDELVGRSTAVDPNDFFPGIWDTNVIDGALYGLPWYVDTHVLFYRRDILAQAGWESMPTTWTEWRSALEAVKRVVGPDRFAVFVPINEWTPPVIFGLQAGSPLLEDGATRGAFSADAFRRGFDFYLELFRDGLAPPVTGNEIANLYQEFARGYFAMYITGPWNLGEFERRLPAELQDAWSTAALPGPDGPGASLAGGSSLVMFRKSRRKDAAWRLFEFLSQPDEQLRFYRLTGDLPARRETWERAELAGEPRIRAFREQLERVEPMPKIPEWEQIASKVRERAELAARGAASPSEALDLLDRDAAGILEKRRWLVEHARSHPGRAGS